jgi:ubiquinone biosynthesis protein UbiJ
LVLEVAEPSPWALAQTVASGQKPPIHIEGDVQLAAEINWLIDHVRWDLEEDLSRVIGDARAHVVMGVAQQVAQALRQWMARPGAAPGGRSGSQVGFP